MVRGPGVESNKLIKDVVVNIDLAPTMVEMAGETLHSVDGISFLPALIRTRTDMIFVDSNDINSNYLPPKRGKYNIFSFRRIYNHILLDLDIF